MARLERKMACLQHCKNREANAIWHLFGAVNQKLLSTVWGNRGEGQWQLANDVGRIE